MVNRSLGCAARVAWVRMRGGLAGVGEKGPVSVPSLLIRIRSPQREDANLPNFAYLPPAYLVKGN
jgi:hypothetical protein